jgi:large subunit ribosomal protein L9
MEVILRKQIEKLGKPGDIVKVKDGYARNLLIPKGWALEATKRNLAMIEMEKRQKLTQQEKKKREAQKLSAQINGASCTVSVEAMEDDSLYGHITASEIATALEVEGVRINKDLIRIEKPIEKLGIYEVDVVLHPEVKTKVRVWVTRK